MRSFLIRFFLVLNLLLTNLSSEEKVYAIMITGKDQFHYRLACNAIKSFQEQTYINKELIIINDGGYNFENIKDKQIKEIHFDAKYSLGELRNLGLDSIPENSIWVQWDDDDWHHPKVISEQYKHLRQHKADLNCMSQQVRYCFQKNCAWIAHGTLYGTIMCRKKGDIKYEPLKKAEDTLFFKKYRLKYKTVVWENPAHFYIRLIHGNNTWGPDHFSLKSKRSGVFDLNDIEKQYLVKVLKNY